MLRLCLLVVLVQVYRTSAAAVALKSVQCSAVGIGNCAACDMPNIDCYSCSVGYVMNTDFSGCTACPSYCYECVWGTGKSAATTVCTLCMPGYILAKDGSCQYCGTNCQLCHWTDNTQKATVCDVCFPITGVILGSFSLQCQTCGGACKTCRESATSTLTCTGCISRYFLSGTTCVACPGFCLECTASNTPNTGSCSSCVTGYIVNGADSTQACLVCPTACSACTGLVSVIAGISACSACNAGYYLVNGQCTPCPIGCKTCTSASQCQDCIDDYALSGTLCDPCSYQCHSCTFANSQETCSQCELYWGIQTGDLTSCSPCPANCLSCSEPGVCTQCQLSNPAYTLNMDSTCTICPPNCASCTTSMVNLVEVAICNSCNSNYGLNTLTTGSQQCVACDANCIPSQCSYDTNSMQAKCGQCVAHYYVTSSFGCSFCGTGCNTCDVNGCTSCLTGYYLDSGSCLPCSVMTNCMECDSATNCTLCDDGYTVNPNDLQCVQCESLCDVCSYPTDSAACTTCHPGSVPATAPSATVGSCVPCDAQCSTVGGLSANCNGTGSCGACMANAQGQLFASDGSYCHQCPANCIGGCVWSRSLGITTCTSCASGYYASSNVCRPCMGNCVQCSSSTVCNRCTAGYVLGGGVCNQCQSTCISCSYNSATTTKVACSSCVAANIVSQKSLQCVGCPPSCTSCMWADSDESDMTCLSCASGYGILNGKCSPCPAFCSSCTTNANNILVCQSCNLQYTMNLNWCGACPPNCLQCSNTQGTMICSQCATGFALKSDGTCMACPGGCLQCTINGNGKTICSAGKCVAGSARSIDGTACQSCSSFITGCNLCSDVSAAGTIQCFGCGLGYILDGLATSCQLTSVLTNCHVAGARAYECARKSCQSPFTWITDGPAKGLCGLNCAVCGDIDTGDFRPASECQNAAGNYTQDYFPDGCWVARIVQNGVAMYARGPTKQYNCTSDYSDEVVSASGSSTICCTSGDNCNANLLLDGVAGASAITFSLALLFASLIAALLR